MFLKVNHKAGSDNKIKAGEYEVIVHNCEKRRTQNGNPMVSVDYEIREDVNQEYGGQKIRFDNFVHTAKTEFRFQQLSRAVRLEDGMPIETADDWIKAVMGKPLRIKVTVPKNEKGEDGFPEVKEYMESQAAPPAPVNVGQGDFPF
ncbi:DUF669 domain-containing protein [Shouchella lonarensis]|uniref:DUF669 domain-containing protein n=1 Tax=Shouchella lonarensis TaxID=1464122 RepID=A0A1G6IL82_9BACI|nr:DUF669 domain-containing protein [Shouchella lonarensis]SDC07224.1 Protein of unknown function [Shouchella lonarensis]